MLPIIPYAGMLRPALILLVILLMLLILNLTRTAKWHRKLLVVTLLGYLILLIYATFLSRSVSDAFRYRLSLLGAARDSFSLEGGCTGGLSQVLPRLIQGDFSGISLTSPRSLEGILINILIFVPMGYLLPTVFPKLRWYQVICVGFAATVSIEVVQLFTKLGMFDLDDILNNVIGTVVLEEDEPKEEGFAKPTIRFNRHGESGNIFWILRALCDECKRMGIEPTVFKKIQERVFACGNYEEALAIISEKVNLIDETPAE